MRKKAYAKIHACNQYYVWSERVWCVLIYSYKIAWTIYHHNKSTNEWKLMWKLIHTALGEPPPVNIHIHIPCILQPINAWYWVVDVSKLNWKWEEEKNHQTNGVVCWVNGYRLYTQGAYARVLCKKCKPVCECVHVHSWFCISFRMISLAFEWNGESLLKVLLYLHVSPPIAAQTMTCKAYKYIQFRTGQK